MASQRNGSPSPSSGDHYDRETAGASCWSSRTWHMDDNLGLRAEDAAPRSDAPRDSGRPERVRPRQEARLIGPSLRQFPHNSAEEPNQASPARLVRSALRQNVANLPASRSSFPSTAPRAASESLDTASVHFLVLPASPELCPRACILESRPWIIIDEEHRFGQGSIGPRANLQKEPDRLRGTSLGLAGLDQDRLLASAPGAWVPPFCPFHAKTGGSR